MNKTNHVLRAALAAAGLVGLVAASALPVVAVAEDAKPPEAEPQGAEGARRRAGSNTGQGLGRSDDEHRHRPRHRGQGPVRRVHGERADGLRAAQPEEIRGSGREPGGIVQVGLHARRRLAATRESVEPTQLPDRELPEGSRVRKQYLESAPTDQAIGDIVARAYYLQKDYANARDAAKKVVESSAKPSEQILQVQLASAIELDDRPGIFATLESLVKHYPQPKYWNDLLNNQLFARRPIASCAASTG